jgi:hypothetical protein
MQAGLMSSGHDALAWSVTVTFFSGWGGSLTFGQTDGERFFALQAGVGIGGGATLDPSGAPRVPLAADANLDLVMAGSVQAWTDIVVVEPQIERFAGWDFSRDSNMAPHFIGVVPAAQPAMTAPLTWGLSAGVSATVVFEFTWGR